MLIDCVVSTLRHNYIYARERAAIAPWVGSYVYLDYLTPQLVR